MGGILRFAALGGRALIMIGARRMKSGVLF
jgi:hypothetical protein